CATVPEGWHMLSLYFYNPNGQENRNGWRDFHIELRRALEPFQGEVPEDTRTSPVLARTRVYDFAGSGCWKHFVVQGPASYAIRVGGNNSFNTILNGVFLSAMQEAKGDFSPQPNWAFPSLSAPQSIIQAPPVLTTPQIRGQFDCWRCHIHPETQETPFLSRRAGLLAWRSLVTGSKAAQDEPLRAKWESRLQLWNGDKEQEYEQLAALSWERVQSLYTYARSASWRPHSPNVVPLSAKELDYAEWNKIPWKPYAKGSKEKPAIPIGELKERAARK
ncbi:MAG: hypothetical protein Q4F30_10085, partial [Akkermansia sp.]|nr:hypothetical protein [Akkermansia sp.]